VKITGTEGGSTDVDLAESGGFACQEGGTEMSWDAMVDRLEGATR
jgi:hypothetical protein